MTCRPVIIATVTANGDGMIARISGTGLDPRKLISVAVSKQRLFYIEHNSLKMLENLKTFCEVQEN